MLAGPPEEQSTWLRCSQALQQRPRWLRPLIRKVLLEFSDAWHDRSRDRIAAAICGHVSYQKAWRSERKPLVRHFALGAQNTPPRPSALQALDLPELPTLADLAAWLGLSMDRLLALTRRYRTPSAHYFTREVSKRTSGKRILEIPKSRLRAVQRTILHRLLDFVPCHPAAHGFLSGRSILSGAVCHLEQQVVLNLDLKDFFTSIKSSRVLGLFFTLGYPVATARALASLCTTSHLPQGAPTSPALANLCAYKLDVRLSGLARALGARYTRYADDLTLSGPLEGTLTWLPAQVDAIAREEGFEVNHRKTTLMRRSRRQQVTGVVVNTSPGFRRDERDRLKATLHNCIRYGPASQNREGLADFAAHLRGRIAHVMYLNSHQGERLMHLFHQIVWT